MPFESNTTLLPPLTNVLVVTDGVPVRLLYATVPVHAVVCIVLSGNIIVPVVSNVHTLDSPLAILTVPVESTELIVVSLTSRPSR